MRIAILGSNGFLSNAIVRHVEGLPDSIIDVFGLEEPVNLKYNKFYQINLSEQELKGDELKDYDIIVYCIGAGIQSNLQESNDIIYKLNVTAPVSICNTLENIGYKGIFISFGSYFEIGAVNIDKPLTEKEILFSEGQAANDYTVSKRMLSRYVESSKHSFTYWHFILPTIYGKGENPMRLIPYTVNSIKNGKDVKFTEGNQVRQYIHVDMIPNIIMNAYYNELASGIYNIEGNETLSVKEIVSLIYKYMGKDLPVDSFGATQRADVGMKYLALNGSLLKSKLDIVYNQTVLSSLQYSK